MTDRLFTFAELKAAELRGLRAGFAVFNGLARACDECGEACVSFTRAAEKLAVSIDCVERDIANDRGDEARESHQFQCDVCCAREHQGPRFFRRVVESEIRGAKRAAELAYANVRSSCGCEVRFGEFSRAIRLAVDELRRKALSPDDATDA